MKIPKFLLRLSRTLPFAGLLTFIHPTASAQEAPVFYYYQGERVPLTADPTQVLVRQTVLPTAGTSTSASRARALASPAKNAVATGVPGWSRVALPAGREMTRAAAPGVDLARAAVKTVAQQVSGAFVSPVLRSAAGGAMSPTAHILVRYREGRDPATTFTGFHNAALVSQEQIGSSSIWKVTTNLHDGFAVLALANQLHENFAVKFATPDFIQRAETNGRASDPLLGRAWGLKNTGQIINGIPGLAGFDMQATLAWNLTMGSPSILVLVMDTGVQLDHPDLNVAAGRDFTDLGGDGGPVNVNDNHGTSVAGCVAGRVNDLGAAGIAPNVRIASAKIAAVDADGYFVNYRDSNVVGALDWGRSIGARISNSSWGGGYPSDAIEDAFRRTRDEGMVHFAAAGNTWSDEIIWPSSCRFVIAVGAAANNGARARFSSYGTGLAFLAPGENIITTDRTGSAGFSQTGDYVRVDGTSFASPYAAGVAALLLSRKPNLAPAEVADRMAATCQDMGTAGYDTKTGYGLINAYRALFYRSLSPAWMESPVSHSSLTGAAQTFQWHAGIGASAYRVCIGSGIGKADLAKSSSLDIATLSWAASGLPTDGRRIFVRLFTQLSSEWRALDYSYTSCQVKGLAQIQYPTPGSELSGAATTFSWSAAPNATSYSLIVGTAPESGDIATSGQIDSSTLAYTVSGITGHGPTIYVRLWTEVNGDWRFLDYTYRRATGF